MDSQTSFRMETSEVSRNAGCFLRIEDRLRSEEGKFWMGGCEEGVKPREWCLRRQNCQKCKNNFASYAGQLDEGHLNQRQTQPNIGRFLRHMQPYHNSLKEVTHVNRKWSGTAFEGTKELYERISVLIPNE